MSFSASGNAYAIKSIGESQSKAFMYPLLVVFGVALITIAAKIQVPLWPNPTPVTLQTMAIFAMSAAYGSRLALATILAYICLLYTSDAADD